jgi:hypothetical protein
MTRQVFDIGVATNVRDGLIDVEIGCTGTLKPFFTPGAVDPDGYNVYGFPMILPEAKLLRDMLNDAIEHVEAGGHSPGKGEEDE